MQIGWFILNTGSFSEVWNFCACQAEGPRVASPRGKLGMLSLGILTGRKQSQAMSNLVSGLWGSGGPGGGGWVGLGSCLLDVDPWKLVPHFLQTLPLSLFPFSSFALCPFTVMHHSCESDHMMSPVSRSGESLNLGGVGDPGIASLTFHTSSSTPVLSPSLVVLWPLAQQSQTGSHFICCFLCLE